MSTEIDKEIEKALAGYVPPPEVVAAQRAALVRGVVLLVLAFAAGFGAGAATLAVVLGGA